MIKFCFFIICLLGIFLPKSQQNRNIYIIISSLILIFTIGLRHYTCFIDTPRYVARFSTLINLSYTQVSNEISKDVSFWYVSKVISDLFDNNYTAWLLILAIIYVIPLSILIKRYSNIPYISYLAFFSLGFFSFSMTGLRQTLALSLIIFSFTFLINRKLIPFVIIVIIGSLFHKTALIFLLAYPITNFPLTKKVLFGYALALGFMQLFGTIFLGKIVSLGIDERFENYYDNLEGLSYSGLIQQLMIFFFSFYFLRDKKDSSLYRSLFHLAILGIIFQSLSGFIAEMFRISMYFSIFNIILFANAISFINKKGPFAIAKPLVVLSLFIYFILSKNAGFDWDYYFY